MANKIRGITIEIGGDTSGLNRALKETNNEINSTKAQLRDVEKLLKLDPHNTELLSQKQKLLNDQVEETRTKLDKVKEIQQKLNDEGVDKLSDEYMAVQREIISCEDYLKKAEKEQRNFNASMNSGAQLMSKISDGAQKVADKTEKMSRTAQVGLGAIAGLVGASINSFADYEQLTGGIEAIFGEDSAKKVIENSNLAFKTAGMNANDYMETVTGFSASLIASLGGDTEKAVELSNQAIIDMSDNANRMGTDIDSIMNAYNGFAKGQFNMLDNLKLGYGGNKTEMERLLKDAEALSGVHYDIDNYADVISAIHVIQDSLNITGATAKESASTISGSLNSLKASFQNLITGFSIEGADINALIGDVVENITNLKNNLIPVLETIWENTPTLGKIAVILTTIIAVISPLAGFIASVTGAISGLITVGGILSATLGTAGVTGALGGVTTAIGGVLSAIGFLPIAIIGLVTLIATKGEEIKALLQSVDDFLKNIFVTDFTEMFGPVLGAVLNDFATKFSAVWQFAKDILTGVIDFIQAVFSGDWKKAWETIKTLFSNIFQDIKNVALAWLQPVLNFINTIITTVDKALTKIKELLNAQNESNGARRNGGGGNNLDRKSWNEIVSQPGMPMFANGGVLNGHGQAIVGEAGAELLTLANGKATVTPININMNNSFGDNANGRQVARDLVRQMNFELGRLY